MANNFSNSKIKSTELRKEISKYKTNIQSISELLKQKYNDALTNNKLHSILPILNEFIFQTSEEQAKILIDTCENFSKSEKNKILVYTNVWILGGIERVLSIMLSELSEHYTFILVTSGAQTDVGYPLNSKIHHLKIPLGNPETIQKRLSILSAMLNVSLFIGNPNSLPSFIKIYPVLKKLRIKSIAWNHYNYFFPYRVPFIYQLIPLRHKLLKSASASIWLTSSSALLYSIFNKNTACLSNPSPERTKINPTFGKTIIAVARFKDPMKMKRLDLILKSFQLLLEKDPNARLLVVGSYDKNSYIQPHYKETLGEVVNLINSDSPKVIFAGEQMNVEPYYLQSSVFAMASESEGFGMVLAEAGSFGLPCVVFDYPGLEDIISDGENGFIIPFGDINTMADKLYLLLNDKNVYDKMSCASSQMIKRFDKSIFAEKWEKLINIILQDCSQEQINQHLSENFMPSPNSNFTSKIISEYKNNINFILKQYKETNGKINNNLLTAFEGLNSKWNTELKDKKANQFYIQACKDYEEFTYNLIKYYRRINPIKSLLGNLRELKLKNLLMMTINNIKQYGIKDTLNKIAVMLNLSK